MRSRYTAYVVGAIDYIVETNHPKTSRDVDRDEIARWSKDAIWQGLDIIETSEGGPNDKTGFVEFVARFALEGHDERHHESAEFRRHEGRWFYHDGRVRKGETMRRETPKVGRNDPCPCGSGKKHKKCCAS